jgi:ankyrin repeat protein
VEALLEAGSEVNTIARDGKTPMMAANGNSEIRVLLQKAGANAARTKQPEVDQTLSQKLVEACAKGDCNRVRESLGAGASPNIMVTIGGFRGLPIHLAAAAGHAEVVIELLKSGAEPRDPNACTPVYTAANMGQEGVVRALAEYGVNLEAREKRQGLRAIHMAAQRGHVNVISTLLEFGADKDASDSARHTALGYAASLGHTAVIEVLLRAGANPNKGPVPAVALAEARGQQAAVELLRTASNVRG